MKKILLSLLGLVIIVGGVWVLWPSSGTGTVATTGALYEVGTATTTGTYAMPTAANQLATSTAWTTTGAKWYTASTTLYFPTGGNDSMVGKFCLTSTTTQPTIYMDVAYTADYSGSSTVDVYFPETLDTESANTTHAQIYRTISMASTTNTYACKEFVVPLKGQGARVIFKPSVNIFAWLGFYPN